MTNTSPIEAKTLVYAISLFIFSSSFFTFQLSSWEALPSAVFWAGESTLHGNNTLFCFSSLLLTSLTRERFYPQRPSGQAKLQNCTVFGNTSRVFCFIPSTSQLSSWEVLPSQRPGQAVVTDAIPSPPRDHQGSYSSNPTKTDGKNPPPGPHRTLTPCRATTFVYPPPP